MPGATAPASVVGAVRPGGTAGPGLRVARVVTRDFGGRSETSLDPDLRVFVSDLTRPYGVPLREDLLAEGVGHSYGEMAEGLLRDALSEDEQVDLLILAFSSPDVRPGRSAALHLSRFCPGSPLAFAVCDQGSAAPFTALRIATDYARTGACRRAVVLVVEAAHLHHEPARPVALPQRHCAVLLVCEADGGARGDGGGAVVRQSSGPAADPAPELVRAEWAALGPAAALVLGSGLTAPSQVRYSGTTARPGPARPADRDPTGRRRPGTGNRSPGSGPHSPSGCPAGGPSDGPCWWPTSTGGSDG
ncbi:hypothetical protein GCM10010495_67470 [Kitasatospora herbaricolor]|uniref:2-hydroxy-acid oxidase n=1 Tax=Kitasatospora herbaricolor TaxID=68217 RepID=UPI00174D5658|nr:2-hydroxy-acid oxidase [Kitasatospora herbaricolor]MDQ0306343.1 hypothetical protein [Kitasatospora herbaricolor]GGV40490.1 hypothetical protein GCM10010495_67470 [Kitasatospora herbaricolor]